MHPTKSFVGPNSYLYFSLSTGEGWTRLCLKDVPGEKIGHLPCMFAPTNIRASYAQVFCRRTLKLRFSNASPQHPRPTITVQYRWGRCHYGSADPCVRLVLISRGRWVSWMRPAVNARSIHVTHQVLLTIWTWTFFKGLRSWCWDGGVEKVSSIAIVGYRHS